MNNPQGISLWMEQLGDSIKYRPALDADIQADVVIIGAGYTGLWTAYYLKRQAAQLKIVMLEAEVVGFGASGRNGGWLMGNLLGEKRLLGHLPAVERREAFHLLHDIPDEVARVTEREGIDCQLRKAGVLHCAARYPEQATALQEELHELHALGLDETDYRWLSASELDAQLHVPKAYGALFSPHCAIIQPARLAKGLANTLENLGVQLYEHSPVLDWQAGKVRTAQGSVRADWVVPAVEGYAVTLPPLGRYQLPIQSLMIATEPLSAETWERIGLARGQAFCENSRQSTHGHRSADDRMVFGARAGYRFGGRLRTDFRLNPHELNLRRDLLAELFPCLRGQAISHVWGGNLGMARRFHPHMLRDPRLGIALAGGYGGEGVGASNLAGRTLAALVLQRDAPHLLNRPWVMANARITQLADWEPEPLRWSGYNAIIRSFEWEDKILTNPHSPSWLRHLMQGLAKKMEGLMR